MCTFSGKKTRCNGNSKNKHNKKKTSKSSESTASTISTVELQQIIYKLEMNHFRSTTRKTYYKIWKLFNNFIIKLDKKPADWEDRLTLFVGHLINEKKQSGTIRSYNAAIKAVLKENRIPIHKQLLHCLIMNIPNTSETTHRVHQSYLTKLY